MIIPTTLKITGIEWKIEENEKVAAEGNVFGSTHFRTSTIYLLPSQNQDQKESTLLHEIFHVIYDDFGMSKRLIEGSIIGKNFEEEIVHVLSQGLYQVLKDNDLLK